MAKMGHRCGIVAKPEQKLDQQMGPAHQSAESYRIPLRGVAVISVCIAPTDSSTTTSLN